MLRWVKKVMHKKPEPATTTTDDAKSGFKDALAEGPIGAPRSVATDKEMDPETMESFRQLLNERGVDALQFAPGVEEEMEKAGISKDELLAAFLRSVNGRQ